MEVEGECEERRQQESGGRGGRGRGRQVAAALPLQVLSDEQSGGDEESGECDGSECEKGQ